jgi:hypothetical protein
MLVVVILTFVQSYFAITPKAVMGGCAIYIKLSVGPVSAHLNCAFDAIVQFHPVSSTLKVPVGPNAANQICIPASLHYRLFGRCRRVVPCPCLVYIFRCQY